MDNCGSYYCYDHFPLLICYEGRVELRTICLSCDLFLEVRQECVWEEVSELFCQLKVEVLLSLFKYSLVFKLF